MARGRSATGQFLPATRVGGRGGGQVLLVPSGAGRRIAKRVATRGATAAAKAAQAEKHTLAALAAAAVLGFARRTNTDLPTVGDVQPALLYGLAAWGFGKWGKSRTASHVGTGLLSVGLYEAIAYTRETRDSVDELVAVQAERENESEGVRGVVGDITG